MCKLSHDAYSVGCALQAPVDKHLLLMFHKYIFLCALQPKTDSLQVVNICTCNNYCCITLLFMVLFQESANSHKVFKIASGISCKTLKLQETIVFLRMSPNLSNEQKSVYSIIIVTLLICYP